MARSREQPGAANTEGYTVLARRYRPQSFDEIIGQEHVARALANAIKGNRVAHAYLFTGNRGVGKTSTARILAKALNCENGPTPTPCGTCPMCQAIATGEDVDVLEIDGASNRKIDEVRDIRSNVQYRPTRSRYKIYIIDEVHMLTREAFNALLKTLEEPPPHVKFIFATTEVEKVPITILSRCQRFDFAGIAVPRIVEHLREVLHREGREADDEALERIARRAGGSMRDAQSVLDQLLAFGDERLTAESVHQLFGTARDDRLIALAQAALTNNPGQALDLLDEMAAGGLQMGELLDQLLAYWRDLLVVRAGASDLELSVPPRHRDTLRRQAEAFSVDSLLAGLDILSTARDRLRLSSHGRTLVEMALVRIGRLENLVSLTQLGQWLAQPRNAPAPSGGRPPARALPPEAPKKNAPVTRDEAPTVVAISTETMPQVWAQALTNLTASGMVGRMLAAELEKVPAPAIAGPNTLVLSVPAVYNQAVELLQEAERLRRVEDALQRATGRPLALRVESVASPEAEATAPVQSAPDDAGNAVRPCRRNPREDIEKVPLIRRAMEALGASIQRVDEGFGAQPAPAQGTSTGNEVSPDTEEL